MADFKGEHLQKALRKFGKKTVSRAASLLMMGKRGYDTGKLMKSLDYDLAITANAFALKFNYLNYGEYIDKGRGGAKKSSGGTTFKNILQWVQRKNLRPRNSAGQFVAWKNKSQQQRSIAFVITRKINRFGFKGTGFFTNAFKENFKKLPKQIKKSYALDFDKFMKQTLDELNKTK